GRRVRVAISCRQAVLRLPAFVVRVLVVVADRLLRAAFLQVPCSRLALSRDMRSSTPLSTGSPSGSSSLIFLPRILALMTFIRLARYSSVYFEGSNGSARFSTSCSAILSSWGRTPSRLGNEYSLESTSSL